MIKMGILQDISGFITPVWNGLKATVAEPFNWLKTAAKKVGDFVNDADRWIQNAQNNATFGGIAREIYNSPVYRGIQDVIKGGLGVVDDIDSIGNDIANTIDRRLGNFSNDNSGSNRYTDGGGRPNMSVNPITPPDRNFGINKISINPVGRMRA